MESIAGVFNRERTLRQRPVSIPTDRPQDNSEIGHGHDKLDDMTAKEDRLEAALSAVAEAVAAQANGNGVRVRQNIPAWIAAGVALLALLVAVTGARWTNVGESDLRRDIAVLAEKLTAAEERQKERERLADRERALIDERYRQVSIALETKGIKLPNQ